MISKAYYITTVVEWRKKLAEETFGVSHWIPVDPANIEPKDQDEILILVEADEGGHSKLNASWQALPHPQSQKSVPPTVAAKLAARGVKTSDTTFDVSEMAAAVHPLMKWR